MSDSAPTDRTENANNSPRDPSPTLDDLFRRIAARSPNAIALADPTDKLRVTGQLPLRLTYAEADRAISTLAGRFASAGIPRGAIVGIQLPNTVESYLTVLGVLRAGLVVAMLPQLWRRAALVAALTRVGARAYIGINRIGIVDHSGIGLHAASDVHTVKNVFGFGGNSSDGVTSLDSAISGDSLHSPRLALDPRRPAVVTFDVTAEGMRAVPRNHIQMIAGGLALSLNGDVPPGARICSTMLPGSFAGLTASLTLWLLTGGTLALHHPFDSAALEKQALKERSDVMIAPAALMPLLQDSGMVSRLSALRHVIGIWRAPNLAKSAPPWPHPGIAFSDVYLFGEAGLVVSRRADDGTPSPVKPGAQTAQGSHRSAGEVAITARGTLALRGPMVPLSAYRFSPDAAIPTAADREMEFLDTGFPAKLGDSGAIEITGPMSNIEAVGGYRFLRRDLENWAKQLGADTTLQAQYDPLNGVKLRGRAPQNSRAREALAELGLNPLLIEAFRDTSAARPQA